MAPVPVLKLSSPRTCASLPQPPVTAISFNLTIERKPGVTVSSVFYQSDDKLMARSWKVGLSCARTARVVSNGAPCEALHTKVAK